jgi:hypothetical protein
MKNKILFLLPLFLITAATQCMEQAVVTKPKTIQEIRNNRDYIYQRRAYKESKFDTFIGGFDALFFQNQWESHLKQLREPWVWGSKDRFNDYLTYKRKGYSALGIVTIAIINKPLMKEFFSICNRHILTKKNIHVSFNEKKEHIQELLKIGFKPIEKDKEFALLEKCERCQKKLIFFLLPLLTEINVPQDIINYITLLMWETEESLL